MLSQQEYKDYCKRFKSVERYLRSKSASPEIVAMNICKLREYYQERMNSILIKAGFMFIEEDDSVYEPLMEGDKDLGLFKNGKFLLSKRFIFPVRDMLGNTIALIGWFPDEKKYITTPSKMFSKSCLFYGLEQLGETGIGKPYFLCEGIFDVLSIRSIGLNAVGEMGIISSRVKESMYPLFNRIVGTPDKDSEGKKVIEFDKWSLPSYGSYFRWSGDNSKDIDKLINSYEADDVKALLLSVLRDSGKIITKRI